MGDSWYGHRDPYFEPVGDKDEWIDWDYALIAALQVIEDSMGSSGLPVWVTEAEYIEVNAVRKIDKFQRAIANKTKGTEKKPYVAKPGETWVPEVVNILGTDEEPTYREFLKARRAEFEDTEEV